MNEIKTTELTVKRTIPAAPAQVYEAWLDHQSPGSPWFGTARAILNPVVDGLFYHSVDHAGRSWAHYGRFLALEPGKRIEHTWMSEATRGLESIVTVTLEPRGRDTEVTLRHTNVPDDEMGRMHGEGWRYVLGAMAERLARRSAFAPEEAPDRDIVSTRAFAVPRERLFEAFRDPARLARWWGPKGFSNTFETFDLRPGGTWRFVMHGPDGVDHPNESVFLAVEAPARIAFRHVSGDHPFEMTIALDGQGGGTLVTWRMRHETAEHCAKVRPIVVQANEQNFDRLAAELERMGR